MGDSNPNPIRSLPPRPNREHLKKKSKRFLRAVRDRDQTSIEEVHRYDRGPDIENFRLADAQRILARSYGFASWAKLIEAVPDTGGSGRSTSSNREFAATPAGIFEAARAGDIVSIERILSEQPHLIAIDNPHNWTKTVNGHDVSGSYNKKPVEIAAFFNQPQAVARLLQLSHHSTEFGDPPESFFNALGIAHAMGHKDVVEAIRDDVLELARSRPQLLRDSGERKDTLLFYAAVHDDMPLVESLLELGADVTPRSRIGHTVIQRVLDGSKDPRRRSVARLMVEKGAPVPLWVATAMEDEDRIRQMLSEDPSIAREKWQWSVCYPLVRACELGNWSIVELLLDHGADINADIGEENPRDFGMALMQAYYAGHFDIVHLLLDRGASIDAHPNCATPFIDLVYQDALTADPDAVRAGRGGDPGTEPAETESVGKKEPEVIRLYRRVVSLGGEPNMYSHVKANNLKEIERCLREKPTEQTLNYGCGPNTVFNAICHAAAWLGNANVMELCLDVQPDLVTAEKANENIKSAIRSHNRDGSFSDYRRIIEMNLLELANRNQPVTILPLHLLADDFLENYRYSANPDLPVMSELLELAGMFLEHGCGVNERNPETNHTPLSQAVAEGHTEYVRFLLENGATTNRDDPAETRPVAIAEERGFAEIIELLDA